MAKSKTEASKPGKRLDLASLGGLIIGFGGILVGLVLDGGKFQDVIQYYPQDDMAGGAQFYLGEIAFKSQDYGAAVKAYNVVLETFPTISKAPAAQLHKGLALLLQNKRDAGIHELRSLIQRHPTSPEAMQARSRLNGMGVRLTSPKPSPSAYQPQ